MDLGKGDEGIRQQPQVQLIYTPRFRSRIARIHGYISEVLNSPKAADSIIDSILSACELLKQEPYMGIMIRSAKRPYAGMRYIVSGMYLILYKIDHDKVMVSSIFDTRTEEAARFLDRDIREASSEKDSD